MEHARRIEQLLSEVDVPEEETVEVDAETPPESSE